MNQSTTTLAAPTPDATTPGRVELPGQASHSVRSYKFRIRPNRAQSVALSQMLRDFCGLYNACLQQRIEAYRRKGITIRCFDQALELKAVRLAEPDLARWSFSALGYVIRRVDQTYSSFFKRKRGFPRFRASARYHAAMFRVGDGLSIKNGRVGIVGIPGRIKAVWHRELPGGINLKTTKMRARDPMFGTGTITRQNGKWFLVFSVKAVFSGSCGTGSVGIDLGLNALTATSDGETVDAPRFARKAQSAQRRRQRALARCKRGSKRRVKAKARLAAGSAKIARQRADHAHKLSRSLVTRYGAIAFENLNLNGLIRGILARSVHDAAWGQLVQFTTYKAASAGAEVILVDPRGTSQTCPECGTIKPKKLSERIHRCECGCILDRDVAAARIVHVRAFGNRPGHGLQTGSQRNVA